jgi:hypothetical protein
MASECKVRETSMEIQWVNPVGTDFRSLIMPQVILAPRFGE